jgi:hypothetical protein
MKNWAEKYIVLLPKLHTLRYQIPEDRSQKTEISDCGLQNSVVSQKPAKVGQPSAFVVLDMREAA